MPLFAEVGYHQLRSKISPYLAERIGYGVYNGDNRMVNASEAGDYRGGLYFAGMAGVAINRKRINIIPFISAGQLNFQDKDTDAKECSQFYSIGLQVQWSVR